jgi:hypothetical protein
MLVVNCLDAPIFAFSKFYLTNFSFVEILSIVLLWTESSARKATTLRLYYLRRSFEIDPQGPQTVYGPAFTYIEAGRDGAGPEAFQRCRRMEAPEDLRGLARNGLPEIAAMELKAKGPRMDAVFYLLDAMRLFRGLSLQETKELTFEIGMLGKYWLDINDLQETHVLRALPERSSHCFSSCTPASNGSSEDKYRCGYGRGSGGWR